MEKKGEVGLGEVEGIKQSMDEAVYSTEIPKAWPPLYYYASISAWSVLFWYEVNEQVDVDIGTDISPPEKGPLILLYTVLPTQKSSSYATIHNTICEPSQQTNKYIAK